MNLTTISQLTSLKQQLRKAERGPWLSSGENVLSTGRGKVVATAINSDTARFIAAVNPYDFEKLISNTMSISSIVSEALSSLEGEYSGNDHKALDIATKALTEIDKRLHK